MNKPRILFVCRGNVFRSRLAEAYARSQTDIDWEVSSAGLAPHRHRLDVVPWTAILAKAHGLTSFLTPTKLQLTQELLDSSDLIVFMNADVSRDARKLFRVDKDKAVVWHVKDREDYAGKTPSFVRKRVFTNIIRHVNWLANGIRHAGWADVVDERNQPRGFRLPVVLVGKKGLWHRACHAIITTPNGNVLIQKRSSRIVFAPNLLEISLGGHVDAGEDSATAIVREIYEEIGVRVNQADLKLIELIPWNRYRPHYHVKSHCFMTTYAVKLPSNEPILTAQEKEVASLTFIGQRKLRSLLRNNWLKGVGGLNYPAAYYRRMCTKLGLL